MDALGIAPSSSVLQTDADLSQLNVPKEFLILDLGFWISEKESKIESGEAERTRTVIVFLDREVHTPFCHGPGKQISNIE